MNSKNILRILVIATIFSGTAFTESCQTEKSKKYYQGKPYSDSIFKSGIHNIPGKLQCEYYDFGGEGIAFHDNDTINSGSGRLNPADGSLSE